MWGIRIIHLTLSVARKTCRTSGEGQMHFPSAPTDPCLPQETLTDLGSLVPQRLSCPNLTKGSCVCIILPSSQAHGFLCKENCCKIPMPLVSSTHSHPSTPPCHLRVLAGQRHRQLLTTKVSTTRAESRSHQEIQNSLAQLRCP